jgi:hypothetical protein
MKKTDYEKLCELLYEFGIIPKLFFAKEGFVMDEAVKVGAVLSVQLNDCGGTDFNFNEQGEFVGYNTESINSFVKRRQGGKRGRKSIGRAKNKRRI